MGMKSKLPPGTINPGGAQSFWNEPPAGAEVIGDETVSGRACWKVENKKASGGPQVTWYDKKTFIPVQIEAKASGKKVRTVFSDYRAVKGYEVPHLTEMFSDGKKTVTSKIKKIETNAKLADALFDAEQLEGGEGMNMEALMKQAEEMKQKMMEQQGKGGE
jgi:outer membrane lipoprotein-sorting protein